MPDEKGNELADEDEIPSTPLHAHADGREEDVEGTIVDEDADLDDVTETADSEEPEGDGESLGSEESGDEEPAEPEDVGEEGLGTQSGAIGGGEKGDAELSDTTSTPTGPLDDQR